MVIATISSLEQSVPLWHHRGGGDTRVYVCGTLCCLLTDQQLRGRQVSYHSIVKRVVYQLVCQSQCESAVLTRRKLAGSLPSMEALGAASSRRGLAQRRAETQQSLASMEMVRGALATLWLRQGSERRKSYLIAGGVQEEAEETDDSSQMEHDDMWITTS